jgi:tRNA A-37 threonylcarbamoyl transferase component Bud32
VIHCDLAVRNLLVTIGTDTEKYLVKVNDFGLSKIIANSELYTKTESAVRNFMEISLFIGITCQMVKS